MGWLGSSRFCRGTSETRSICGARIARSSSERKLISRLEVVLIAERASMAIVLQWTRASAKALSHIDLLLGAELSALRRIGLLAPCGALGGSFGHPISGSTSRFSSCAYMGGRSVHFQTNVDPFANVDKLLKHEATAVVLPLPTESLVLA